MSVFEEMSALQKSEFQFNNACNELAAFNQRLDDIQARYNRAHRDNQRTFRYSLRIQLSVLEGIRDMFIHYAHAKADLVMSLRAQAWSEEETDMDTDEESDLDGSL